MEYSLIQCTLDWWRIRTPVTQYIYRPVVSNWEPVSQIKRQERRKVVVSVFTSVMVRREISWVTGEAKEKLAPRGNIFRSEVTKTWRLGRRNRRKSRIIKNNKISWTGTALFVVDTKSWKGGINRRGER